MRSRSPRSQFTERRLRIVLGILFVSLAVPTGVIVRQAYDQLKWESWFQYRSLAESLASVIDGRLEERMEVVEGRGFSDFSFLSAPDGSKFVQRSPLSAMPVSDDLPGVVGYFQLDPDGRFSSPLLPADGSAPADFGLADEDVARRRSAASSLQRILADNRLVRSTGRPATDSGRVEADARADEMAVEASADTPASPAREAIGRMAVAPRVAPADDAAQYEQRAFDALNSAVPAAPGIAEPNDAEEAQREQSLGKLADLVVDEDLQSKTERFNVRQAADAAGAAAEKRFRAAEPQPAGSRPDAAGPAAGAPISTFATEIEPYQLSLLDSGHLVLYRNAWRGGQRYIQGLLIEARSFLDGAAADPFTRSALASMSDLIVGYEDDVIRIIRGLDAYPPAADTEFAGTLLYRTQLSAPFDRMALAFSINNLPPGPGAGVLGWSTIVIAIVFVGGFLALYRLGTGQLRLARQQQDFVSAVSHELKTPLTSIRLYGEMLREGWADESRRQQYYTFIHDEAERLTRMISNVLRLASITRNEPQLDCRSHAAAELLARLGSRVQSMAESSGFRLTLDAGALQAGQAVVADEDAFVQIMINLVDNAIKFSRTAPEREIIIAARPASGGAVVFAVRDHGPGIPANQLRKIFRLFYRSESELTRETAGTGIGLAIVHQLTLAMGGDVDVVNKDPGVEFRITLPGPG